MSAKPFQIDLSLNKKQRSLRLVSMTLLGIMIISAIYYYNQLPDQIPRHFNLKGEVDAYGSKNLIWFILGAFGFMNILLSLLLKYPKYINYPIKINPENAQRQFSNAVDMTMMLNLLINVVGLVILFMVIDYELAHQYHINKLLGLLTILIFGVAFYYIFKGYKGG